MKDEELQIIEQLTGATAEQIRLADDGFWSRGYVIDDGRIVFKFKKSSEVSYQTEIKALDFINSLNPGINTQKVGWISPDDSYLGIYGVRGRSLDTLKNPDYSSIGKQLADFLCQIHNAHPENAEIMTQDVEIAAWQKRYQNSRAVLKDYFSTNEITRLDYFFLESAPVKLRELGEKLVFSHGDLGDGNIFVDEAGKVGVIDFSEMLYLDEAADFMDVSSDELREAMLTTYAADETLRAKVHLRVLLRPLFVLGDYAKRGDAAQVESLIAQIKKLLEGNNG